MFLLGESRPIAWSILQTLDGVIRPRHTMDRSIRVCASRGYRLGSNHHELAGAQEEQCKFPPLPGKRPPSQTWLEIGQGISSIPILLLQISRIPHESSHLAPGKPISNRTTQWDSRSSLRAPADGKEVRIVSFCCNTACSDMWHTMSDRNR